MNLINLLTGSIDYILGDGLSRERSFYQHDTQLHQICVRDQSIVSFDPELKAVSYQGKGSNEDTG